MTLLHSVGEFHKKSCSILSSGMVDVISSAAGSQPLRQYITQGAENKIIPALYYCIAIYHIVWLRLVVHQAVLYWVTQL